MVGTFSELLVVLSSQFFSLDKDDVVTWTNEISKVYWVSSYYATCLQLCSNILPAFPSSNVFRRLWSSYIPMNIKIVDWRVCLDMIASKDQLLRRGIIHFPRDLPFPLCLLVEENLQHLFLECNVSKYVWNAIFRWVGFDVVEGEGILDNVLGTCSYFEKKVRKNKTGLISWVVLWGIWNNRNAIIFYGLLCNMNSLVWTIKSLSWRWYLIGEMPKSNFNFTTFMQLRCSICLSL